MGDLRGLVRDANFTTLGVSATVTPVGGDPVETRVIWCTPSNQPVGPAASGRLDTRRLLAIRTDDVAAVARGTIVEVPEPTQTEPARWKVDGIDRVEPDHVRVFVIAAPEES